MSSSEKNPTIGFHMIDEYGNEFSQESCCEIFTDLGEDTLTEFGRRFNNFIRQCGYLRRNDYILMEDITEEEYEELLSYLSKIRSGVEESEGNESD